MRAFWLSSVDEQLGAQGLKRLCAHGPGRLLRRGQGDDAQRHADRSLRRSGYRRAGTGPEVRVRGRLDRLRCGLRAPCPDQGEHLARTTGGLVRTNARTRRTELHRGEPRALGATVFVPPCDERLAPCGIVVPSQRAAIEREALRRSWGCSR